MSIPVLPETFVAQLDVGDCWLWMGHITKRGYGRCSVTVDGVRARPLVHRFAWESLVGPVQTGLELDHLCMVKRCANPDHLQPVTHAENMRRAVAANPLAQKRLLCAAGHDNWGPSGSKRRCRTCSAARTRSYRERLV